MNNVATTDNILDDEILGVMKLLKANENIPLVNMAINIMCFWPLIIKVISQDKKTIRPIRDSNAT